MSSTAELLDRLAGGLIVSCQAYDGEPLQHPDSILRIAQSAVLGGAAAVRLEGLENIANGRELGVPVIGIVKVGDEGVRITPTLDDALRAIAAGADIIAIDGTRRPRPDGLSLAQTVAGIRAASDAPIMADCGSLGDALAAEQAGVDLIGTTLAGYSGEREPTEGPDLELIAQLRERLHTPIVAEGRIHSTEHAAQARRAGAFAVCVGTAITHPSSITRWFTQALHGADN